MGILDRIFGSGTRVTIDVDGKGKKPEEQIKGTQPSGREKLEARADVIIARDTLEKQIKNTEAELKSMAQESDSVRARGVRPMTSLRAVSKPKQCTMKSLSGNLATSTLLMVAIQPQQRLQLMTHTRKPWSL